MPNSTIKWGARVCMKNAGKAYWEITTVSTILFLSFSLSLEKNRVLKLFLLCIRIICLFSLWYCVLISNSRAWRIISVTKFLCCLDSWSSKWSTDRSCLGAYNSPPWPEKNERTPWRNGIMFTHLFLEVRPHFTIKNFYYQLG